VLPLLSEVACERYCRPVRVPILVLQRTDTAFLGPAQGKYVADQIPGAKYVELPGRNMLQRR
jgi:pimeloyl-ACP methyl ester carboxylesterase